MGIFQTETDREGIHPRPEMSSSVKISLDSNNREGRNAGYIFEIPNNIQSC